MPLEQIAVYVREEPGQVLVERHSAFVLWRVEHFEQLREPWSEIGPVLSRTRLDEIEEDVTRLEHPGVICKHAEHDAHEKPFQIMTSVSGIRKCVMQPPDEFGGLDVRRILITKLPALNAKVKAERLDMRRQVRESESDGLPLVQVVKLEGLEIAHQNVARPVALGQCVEILPCLFEGRLKIAPGAFLLDDQHTGPEKVYEARTIVQLRDMRLVARDTSALHCEHVEEGGVEALRFAFLIGRPGPASLRRRRRRKRELRSTKGALVNALRIALTEEQLAFGRKSHTQTNGNGRVETSFPMANQ